MLQTSRGCSCLSCTNKANRAISRGCTCLRSALPLARARSAPTKQTVQTIGGYGILPYPRRHQTIFPQKPQNPQKPLAEISSHRCHRCSQIFLTEIFSHGLHRTHRILAPSMCNCRRVWHPCHTHAPYQGVHLSQVHQPSSHCILPQNSPNSQKPLAEISSHRWHRCAQIFLAEIFSHGLHRTRRILVPSLCNYRRVWHPCHTHADTKLSSHRSHRTLRSLTICGHLRNPWEALLRQKFL